MEIKLKTTKLTKSKILQMSLITFPLDKEYEVLGWVNIGSSRYVILKIKEEYFRAEYITKISKRLKKVQICLETKVNDYVDLTEVYVNTINRSALHYSPRQNEKDNLNLYDKLYDYQQKTNIQGQIYY